MWATALGVAAANKAATALVVAGLVASAGTAELTGIGPAVRESLGVSGPSSSSNAGGQSGHAQSNGLGIGNDSGIAPPSSDEPGLQVMRLRPNGSFSVRGTLGSADGSSLTVETSDGPVTLNIGEAAISLPGENANPNDDAAPKTLASFVDHVVFLTGTCIDPGEGVDLNIQLDCTADHITVLGRAGQGGQPEDAGKPDVLPGNAPEDTGKPDVLPSNAPDGAGRPDGVGQPENAPPVTPGGNPNSD